MEVSEEGLAEFFSKVLPLLDERQKRLTLGAAANMFGRGGKTLVAEVAGVSRSTVITGANELASGEEIPGRVRRPGAGRPRLTDVQPDLLEALDGLVAPETRGDPESPLRWTLKSTAVLTKELVARGYRISAWMTAKLLHTLGYSLQAPSKQVEGAQHPDRDAQFRYINDTASEFLAAGQPVISVDTKKKELVGNYANGGREWQPKADPTRVELHDFPDPAVGKAVPYGVYDLAADEGWVSVGNNADTAAFAVASIERWWTNMGQPRYPHATRVLICADAGGSNSYRTRLWKIELARLAERSGLAVTVCHFPPGTSKWNKIEHRLFSYITMNWRGRPLTSYRTIVELISATTHSKGLRVQAELDTNIYPKGIKVSDRDLAAVPLHRHEWHGEWNYTITHPVSA